MSWWLFFVTFTHFIVEHFTIAATGRVLLSTVDQNASNQCKLDIPSEHLKIKGAALSFLYIWFNFIVTALCPMLFLKCYSSTWLLIFHFSCSNQAFSVVQYWSKCKSWLLCWILPSQVDSNLAVLDFILIFHLYIMDINFYICCSPRWNITDVEIWNQVSSVEVLIIFCLQYAQGFLCTGCYSVPILTTNFLNVLFSHLQTTRSSHLLYKQVYNVQFS